MLVPDPAGSRGTAPHPDYSCDGISLLPVLTGERGPEPRRLFWRYKTNAQRAMRDGDWKYLKIRDTEYLFNVVEDPRERANLKERQRATFARLTAEWAAWNAAMLPEIPDSFGESFIAARYADHIGL